MKPAISLLVPTMANPWHLDTTVRSALRHARPGTIEALVFSNQHGPETDGILEGFRRDGLPARLIGKSHANEGVAIAVNACMGAAVGDFLFYVGDDYYFLPGWDEAMLRRVRPRAWQYLTPRSIEPSGENPCMYAPCPFGRGPDDFREADLLAFWKALPKKDVVSRFGPPFLAAGIWKAVGGFDVGYWPGFGTDPDFAISIARKAHDAGEGFEFLGVGDAGIYHFQCITTARLRSYGATEASRTRFREKWGMLPDDFGRSIGEGGPPETRP